MDVYDGSKELKVRMDDWGGRVDTYSFLVVKHPVILAGVHPFDYGRNHRCCFGNNYDMKDLLCEGPLPMDKWLR